MCEAVSDRKNMVQYSIDGGEGRDGERSGKNEEVSERRGELSNSKLFLRS
jgi:hypothetical protein